MREKPYQTLFKHLKCHYCDVRIIDLYNIFLINHILLVTISISIYIRALLKQQNWGHNSFKETRRHKHNKLKV